MSEKSVLKSQLIPSFGKLYLHILEPSKKVTVDDFGNSILSLEQNDDFLMK